MIGAIKIYDGNGVLKEEIPAEKAKEYYNKHNEADWLLSPSERRHWKGLKLDDPLPKKEHRPRWLNKKYKKQLPVYETICMICKKKTMKASKEAKYCGSYCYGVSRRKKSRELYEKKKSRGPGPARL